MDSAIKTLGLFNIKLVLHPEVTKQITVNVARSLEEAKTQLASGKAVISGADKETQAENYQASKSDENNRTEIIKNKTKKEKVEELEDE